MNKSRECRICHKEFSRPCDVKRHERSVHGKNGGIASAGVEKPSNVGSHISKVAVQKLADETSLTERFHERELNAEKEKHRATDVLTYIFGKELQKSFNSIVQERCKGCLINHPNYLKHSCMWLEDDDLEVDGILKRSLVRLDIPSLKATYQEMANILGLKLPLSFFYHRINALKDLWDQLRQFGVVVTAMRNMNFGEINDLQSLVDAEYSARQKINAVNKGIHLEP